MITENKDIPVVIAAGGFGTRLRPITDKIPKPMVNVGGLPILHHTLNWFKFYGFKNFTLCLCYLPEIIQNYFNDGSDFGVKIDYVFEDQENPLGSAGAVSLALDKINSPFIVTYADILRKLDLNEFVSNHFLYKSDATISLHRSNSLLPKSKVDFNPKTYRIKKFIERPTQDQVDQTNWSNGSLYMFNPSIKAKLEYGIRQDFGHDIFPKLLADKARVFSYPVDDYFIDIGDIDKLQQAEYDIKSGKFKTYDNN